jgi:hypothetical protein
LAAQRAILKIGLRHQQEGLERARYEKERASAAVGSTEIANRTPSQIMEQQTRHSGLDESVVPGVAHVMILQFVPICIQKNVGLLGPLFIMLSLHSPEGIQHFTFKYGQRAAVIALRFARHRV